MMRTLERLIAGVEYAGNDVAFYFDDDLKVMITKSKYHEGLLHVRFVDEEMDMFFETISDILTTIENVYDGFLQNWGVCYDVLYALKFNATLTTQTWKLISEVQR